MSERIEYVVKDGNGKDWKVYDTEAVAVLRAPMLSRALPDNGPFTVYRRVTTETPLAPGAPETAP